MIYSGGGFLCVELYTNPKTLLQRPAIILGEEAYGKRSKGKYADFGGGHEKKDANIYHTIYRETFEELYTDLGSSQFVKKLPFVDVKLEKRKERYYKMCIGRIDGITNDVFLQWREYYKNFNNGTYSPYVEIERIRHFYLDDIESTINSGISGAIPDVNGVICLLRSRVTRALENPYTLHICRELTPIH